MYISTQWPDTVPEQKRKHIIQIIYERIGSNEEQQQLLDELESASEYDADEILANLLMLYACGSG
jgi:ubiquinone biosynthesis protein COQ9